jgi:hypothetical protein
LEAVLVPTPTPHDEEIEAKARAMMRDSIERSGWYPLLQGKFRQERIEQDVEQH